MPVLTDRPRGAVTSLRDVLELAKPRITLLVVVTAGVGLLLAPGSLGAGASAIFLAATALLVASANTLNCWMERESDGRMARTRGRALPSGRLSPRVALAAGLAEVAIALPLLVAAANPLTALLGAIAHATYVLAYTPLKRVSPVSLVVGAVPGALPPLMGWAAVSGGLGPSGWELSGILFFWQIPHFIAIALYLEEDYRRGGLRVLSVERGGASARLHLLVATALLVAVSILAVPLGLAGPLYLSVATILGAAFVALAWSGVRRAAGARWARRTFLYSLVYLTGLFAALVLDAK
jgi:heme o synthase